MYDPKKAFNSFQWSDRSYRRGLVLGLTVAEIFLLLLFLLLLALALLHKQWSKILEDKKAEIAAFEEFEELSPEQRHEVILAYPDHIKAEKQLDKLKRELKEEKEARQKAEQILSSLGDSDISEVVGENKSLKKTVEEQTRVIGSLSRGRDPSCWATYDTSEEQLEKVEFLFNVGVFDSYLVVNDRELTDSPKKQIFLQEKGGLPLEAVRWDKPMSDTEFLAATHELFKLGKRKKIRNYSCVFHVLVWDMTSSQGKLDDRWKSVTMRVLTQRFYTLPVFDDPWPGSISNSRL